MTSARHPRGIASLVLLIAGAAFADPAPTPPADDRISDLLPPDVAQSRCYSGTFSGQSVELQDWSDPGLEPVPGVFQFGKQVMRPKPETLPAEEIASLTLRLIHDDRKADYDWIYNFILLAEMRDGSRKMFGAGECPWYATPQTGSDGETSSPNTIGLACYIDCDGGGMALRRVSGQSALELYFYGHGIGLRMSAGCGGGGSYRIGTGETDQETAFRIEPAEDARCKPLVDWQAEN